MTTKVKLAAAFGAVALTLPALASAQGYYGQPGYAQGDGRGYYDRGDDAPRGDYDRYRRGDVGPYPEFRGIEQHIRQEIQGGVREDLIERDDARDLMDQLRDIQNRERREYAVHGWNLPGDDRERIRDDLNRLDRLVDRIRSED